MAVSDEKAMSMVPEGNTYTVKSFPAAIINRLSNSSRPLLTAWKAISNLFSGRSSR